jgi:STE24 endopeptidase
MIEVKRVVFGLAAIAGFGGAIPSARAAFPDDGQVVSPLPDFAGKASTSPEATGDAPVMVPAPSEKALRYRRGGNAIWAVEEILSIALPLLLLFTGLSAWLRSLAGQLARGRFYPTLAIYFVLLSLLLFLIELPLSYYIGFAREHAYGLSTQHFSKWASDQVKGSMEFSKKLRSVMSS